MPRTDMGGGRGLGLYYETEDLNGQRIKVSESSLATEEALRIYVDEKCAHLNVLQALRVYEAIADWLEWIGEDELLLAPEQGDRE